MQQVWIFKSKFHYMGYLVETDSGVQPLPEKIATIEAWSNPKI